MPPSEIAWLNLRRPVTGVDAIAVAVRRPACLPAWCRVDGQDDAGRGARGGVRDGVEAEYGRVYTEVGRTAAALAERGVRAHRARAGLVRGLPRGLRRVLFCDTDAFTTAVFHEAYLGSRRRLRGARGARATTFMSCAGSTCREHGTRSARARRGARSRDGTWSSARERLAVAPRRGPPAGRLSAARGPSTACSRLGRIVTLRHDACPTRISWLGSRGGGFGVPRRGASGTCL